jgi:hypothetical protein
MDASNKKRETDDLTLCVFSHDEPSKNQAGACPTEDTWGRQAASTTNPQKETKTSIKRAQGKDQKETNRAPKQSTKTDSSPGKKCLESVLA